MLAGGVGGARFLLGVRAWAREHPDADPRVTAIVNTGDDMWLSGLRITPDLDSIMYALAGVNDTERGWGRVGESERVSAELAAWDAGWPWFTLGDLDLGAHIARTGWLRDGVPLHRVVERLTARWDLGVRLLPATDDEVETHVRVAAPDAPGHSASLHFQEWWTRYRATLPPWAFEQRGVDATTPAPGVAEAIAAADVILVAPSNPVVSIGTILGIPGMRALLAGAAAPIVGVSPIIGGSVVRGMADVCLAAIGVETDAAAVARHYGARSRGGLLDGWLVDPVDGDAVPGLEADGIPAGALPLLLRDEPTGVAIVRAALGLAAGR